MVLDSDYPSNDNLYGDVFVHTRVKAYQKYAIVKVVSFLRDIEDYEYDGVTVNHAPAVEDIIRISKEYEPDYIFIHFYNRELYEFIAKVRVPVIIWVHGYEALGWYRRLFNFTAYSFLRNMHTVIPENMRQMRGFRRVVEKSNKEHMIRFVFVSNWMKNVAEKDAGIKILNYSIIPNPIDTERFSFYHKTTDQRKKILMIRSFNSRKYANDVAIEAILILSGRKIFNDLEFTIYGKGKYFEKLTEPLKQFQNVQLFCKFLDNREIPSVHRDFGLFLCPTRQDAQGVSMCEAMSAGLVPVTTKNTAIPEYVENGVTGLTGKNAKQLASLIENIYNAPEDFLMLSRNASDFIKKKCAFSSVIEAEMSLIQNAGKDYFLKNAN